MSSRATQARLADMTSASIHTTNSPVQQTSDAHSTLPLPAPVPNRCCTSSIGTTVAPAARASSAERSVERSSMTTSSSIRSDARSSSRIAATTRPTVASSLRHGRHTETRRVPLSRMADSMSSTSTKVSIAAPQGVRGSDGSLPSMLIFGVVNCSPDSLNTDSYVADGAAAARRIEHLLADGADAVDIGGQGSTEVAELSDGTTEWARVEPALQAAVARGVDVSIDTWRVDVAEQALAAGATTLNAANGMQDDAFWAVAADHGAAVVLP